MDWTELGASATPGIDWAALCARPIDPYLIWAALTGFAGSKGPGTDPSQPQPLLLRVALHLAPAAKVLPGLRPIVGADGAQFTSASVDALQLSALLNDPNVHRLELGFADHRRPKSIGLGKIERLKRPVLAVIDFGCAFAHEQFRHRTKDGWRSRIRYLWDQSPDAVPGSGWRAVGGQGYGRELTGDAIEWLLRAYPLDEDSIDEDAVYRSASYDSVSRRLSHGTHVLDLAAGASFEEDYDAHPEIIFVQLPNYAVDDTSGSSMVTHVLDALRYILDRVDDGVPVVLNLSYGSMAGPHDGTTLIEAAMDAAIDGEWSRPAGDPKLPRHLFITLPAGNNFESDGHATFTLAAGGDKRLLSWQVLADDDTDSFLEIWYPRYASDVVEVIVTPPDGTARTVRVGETARLTSASDGQTIGALIHRRRSSAGRDDAMVLVAIAPTRSRDGARPVAPAGVWQIEVVRRADPEVSGPVEVHAWIERDDQPVGAGAPPRQSRFVLDHAQLPANADSPPGALVQRAMTCSSIANGSRTLVVGACMVQGGEFSFSRYSSAGPSRNPQRTGSNGYWPDLVALGDESRSMPGILGAGTRSGISVRMNGTSVAAPQLAKKLIGLFRDPLLANQWHTEPQDELGKWLVEVDGTDPSRLGRGRLMP